MKNKLLFFLLAALLVFLPLRKTFAVVYNTDPTEDPDHFVWDLMAQMQTPDDPDCDAIAEAYLISEGVPAGEAPAIAANDCNHLADMRTDIQSHMNQGDETTETNLFDAADWHNVQNLYFEHQVGGISVGKISFSVPIDFMSYNFTNFLRNFGENMEAETGYISLDADIVGGFADYGAILTMYNVPEFNNPEILVDGGEDTEGVVSNLVYDEENDTITFSAAHFSSFEVVESTQEPELDKISAKKFFNPNLGQWRVKVKIRGDDFDNSTEVTAGGREAYKIKKRSSEKIVAYFSLAKLERAGKDKFTIRVTNDGETEKFKDRLTLSELTTEYIKLD